MGEHGRVRRLATVALGIYQSALIFVLLNPSASVPSTTVAWVARVAAAGGLPAQLTSADRIEFVLNLLILIPLPLLGSLIWPRMSWRDWTACGFVVSAGVELVQALLLPGRSATFADIVANTLGTGMGAVAVLLVRWVCRSPQIPQPNG